MDKIDFYKQVGNPTFVKVTVDLLDRIYQLGRVDGFY